MALDSILAILLLFVVAPFVGRYYVGFVHWLGAKAVKWSPRWLARILSGRLWRTEWDRARDVDRIAMEREDKLNKRY